METASPPAPSPGDVLLLVGTMKGAFLLWSNGERGEWRMEGPYFRGEAVYALAFDQRGGRRRILAGGQSMHWGSVVRASDDFGVPNSRTSAPPLKTDSPPVTTTARTTGSASARSSPATRPLRKACPRPFTGGL